MNSSILIILIYFISIKAEFIKYEEEGTISIITINRPEALNSLNSKVLDELSKVLDKIDINKIKSIIITGAGEKSFVAGADISEMSTLTKKQASAFSKKGNDVFRKIETYPIPVIAAINGFALGGGCELSLSCDIRICSDNAIFGQPEVGLGIIPGFGGTQRLARIVGIRKAKQMIFSGQNIKADEALRIGLVNAVYPQNELLNEAKKLALSISNNAQNAIKNSKKAINEGYDLEMDNALALEEKLFGDCFQNNEQIERMKDFLKKHQKKKKIKDLRKIHDTPLKKEEEEEEYIDEKQKKEDEEFLYKPFIPINTFDKIHSSLRPFTTPQMPAILTAGNRVSHNSCIIGYGTLGVVWNKPVFVVYVKPDRYTYQFMQWTTHFTVSFIKKSLFKKFELYGEHTGKFVNKEEQSGSHMIFFDNGGITFREAEEVYVCRMLAKSSIDEKDLAPDIINIYKTSAELFKESEEPHNIYIGEIIGYYKRDL